MKPMFGFRNTFIYDAEGKPCYKTWSMGAFVDKSNGKLKRVDDATIASMTLEPQLEINYKDRRIILPKEDGETLDPIKVLRADIDYNKHLNNANYIRMAMELLPELGDQLIPTIFQIDGGIIVSLSIGSERLRVGASAGMGELSSGMVSAIIEFTKE